MKTSINRGIRTAAVALAAVLLAAGCGSGTPGERADSDNEESEGGGGGEGGGPTVVTFWQHKYTPDEDEWYKGMVEEFNDTHDDIQIKHETVPGDAWEQRMTAAQAAGNAPDIRTANFGSIVEGAKTKQILPLTEHISEEAWNDISENVLESVTADGERYAYPLLVEPSAVLYYRTDLFEEAGLDPNSPPTTWDQLIEYAEKLTTDQVFGMRLAQNATDMGWSTWGYQLNVAGHPPISEDWSTADAGSEYAPLLQVFQDLFNSGALPPDDQAGYPDAIQFGEGKYAMMANGSWAASPLLSDFPDIVDKVAAAPMPSFSGQPGETTATLGGWTLVVDGKSDYAAEAGQFIEWMLGSDPERVIPYFEATFFSKISPRTSVDEAIAAMPEADEVNPWRKVIAEEVVPYGAPEPAYPWGVSLAMGEAIEAAMQGTSVDKALEEANKKIQTEIDNSGLAGEGS